MVYTIWQNVLWYYLVYIVILLTPNAECASCHCMSLLLLSMSLKHQMQELGVEHLEPFHEI